MSDIGLPILRHSGARAQHANPESRAQGNAHAALDSGPGAFAPSRNDSTISRPLRKRLGERGTIRLQHAALG
ncbi:MAG: hypothetical protein WCA36_19680, partial [Pseudolabrys sp.]